MKDAGDITVEPLSFALGGAIEGVDIQGVLEPNTVSAVQEAWNKFHVLVFRGSRLTPEQIVGFARQFGELDRHDATPFYRLDAVPELMQITNIEIGGKPSETRNTGRNWHSDYSYTSRPAAASMLYCGQSPRVGGDTMFCNMVRAYESLSPRFRELVDQLEAVYDIGLTAGIGERDREKTAELRHINPPIAHPAVRVHPLSGKRALYVSERVSHFRGMTRDESLPLIQQLCSHATQSENVYRHRWQVGDLVAWDNRTTMHLALTDFDQTEPRYMLRATLLGDPSGVVVEASDV